MTFGITHLARASHPLSDAERYSIAQLTDAHKALEIVDGHFLTCTDAGQQNCRTFLRVLEDVAVTLHVHQACRQYRHHFTANYKLLFAPFHFRHYRFDVLEAAIEKRNSIWVNGEKFEFDVKTLRSAARLQKALEKLHNVLQRDLLVTDLFGTVNQNPLKCLHSAMTRLDSAWAYFERKYISELIAVEAKSRSPLIGAVEQEQLLTAAISQNTAPKEDSDRALLVVYRRQKLVETINQLNSIANHRGKGRSDLDVSILEDAMSLLNSSESGAGYSLAGDVVAAFDALCEYFCRVSKCLQKLDPQLAKNAGLVDRLVDWETSWELLAKYRKKSLLDAVSDATAVIRDVQFVEPSLKEMCENCDAELFMCVPRLLWLRFLENPDSCGELFRTLLPHRFPASLPHLLQPSLIGSSLCRGDSTDASGCPDVQICAAMVASDFSTTRPMEAELSELRDRYQSACQHVLRQWPAQGENHAQQSTRRQKTQTHPVAWELLSRRAVLGTDGAQKLYASMLPHQAQSAMAPVEDFMRELERWSMELQRHAPEEWNQCSSIILQCLVGENERVPVEFKV